MKKIVQVLAVVVAMSLSVSLAQADRLYIEGQSRASLTFSTGVAVSIVGAVGVKNIAGPLGLRGQATLDFGSGGSSIAIGADALFSFGNPRDSRDAEFYAGAGLRIFAGGGTAFGLNGVAGVEFPLNPRLSVNAEFVPILIFGSGTQFIGQILAGFRIYP